MTTGDGSRYALPAGVSPDAIRPDLERVARIWGGGWGRLLFPGFWLVYLGAAIDHVARHQHGANAVAGFVIVAAFAISYLVALPMGWGGRPELFWPLYALCIALTVGESFYAGKDALVFCVYLAVLTIASRSRFTRPLVAALIVVTIVLPRVIPSWGGKIDWNQPLTVLLVSIAMFGFFKIVQSNIALAAARAEVARLAAENERSRIARDLHDLLGHSLTAITVKAGLARRLAERGEAERSLTEIREVEALSRRTLADVRAAVAGHRDVTLVGELATGREVLRAAGIVAELPGSVDVVDPTLSELFGWVVREGITNVVRHSQAAHCVISLGTRHVRIEDDGRGGAATAGNGLAGLRERVAAYGGTVEARGTAPGWRLTASVPQGATRSRDGDTGAVAVTP
ncbi:MAG: Two-component system, NarL family, sensor histidine kinase DesK [Pseudonocardiales bacterium]|nr:Two-component system, NarL family, sensor histidine kinase DesK [Pseudonocardiales bacterium]